MPRVRLLVRMNVADGHHEQGEEVDVPGDIASYLVEMSRAEIVRGEQPTTPEQREPSREATARSRRERGGPRVVPPAH